MYTGGESDRFRDRAGIGSKRMYRNTCISQQFQIFGCQLLIQVKAQSVSNFHFGGSG